MRQLLAFGLSVIVLGAFSGNAVAQGPSPSPSPAPSTVSQTLCITVLAPIPQGWTIETLVDGIKDGTITVQAVGGPTSCAPAAEPSVEPSPTEAPASDEPADLVVTETGFTIFGHGSDADLQYAIVIKNPNPTNWVANSMSVDLAFLDKSGDVLTTDSTYITALPGQTTAITDDVFDAAGTASIEVTIANDSDSWQDEGTDLGSMTFTGVKTRFDSGGAPITTGRMVSSFSEDQEAFLPTVYRNKADKVIGGALGLVDTVKAGGTAAFSVDGDYKYPGFATAEVYYEIN